MPFARTVVIDEDDTDGFVFDRGNNLILQEGVTLSNNAVQFAGTGIALDASQDIADRSYLIKGDIDQELASGISIGMDVTGKDADITVAATGSVRSEDIGIALEGDSATLVIAKGGVVEGAGTGIDLDLATDAKLTVKGRLLSAETALPISAEGVVVTVGATGLVKGDIVAEGNTRQSIVNQGKIVGDIFLGDDSDLYNGSKGELQGRVLGGRGNDSYLIGNAATDIRENFDEGTLDTVASSVSFALSANLEQLFLVGAKDINAIGNGDANRLGGNDGDNRLNGKGGNDILDGGDGLDVFVFQNLAGADTVLDFQNNKDRFDLSAVTGIDNFNDIKAFISKDGDDTVIDLDTFSSGLSITLAATGAGKVDASDFQF